VTVEIYTNLLEILDYAKSKDNIKLVYLTGDGNYFSAGADLN
jgi:enoyl-CoA hydratase/carnithine racemase